MKDLATEKIEKFKTYEKGWHGGEGIPFSATTIERAANIIKMLKDYYYDVADAFPATDGTLGIYAFRNNFHLDITISESDSYLLVAEEFEKEILRATLSLQDLEKDLDRIRQIRGCFNTSADLCERIDDTTMGYELETVFSKKTKIARLKCRNCGGVSFEVLATNLHETTAKCFNCNMYFVVHEG